MTDKLKVAMKKTKKYFVLSLLAVISLICLYLIIVLGFWFVGNDKIYPGVTVAGVTLSGKNKAEAETLLKEKTDTWNKGKINLNSAKPTVVNASDLKIEFEIQKTLDEAISVGGKNPFILGFKRNISLRYKDNADLTFSIIGEQDKGLRTAVVNSKVEKKDGNITVINGVPGKRVNYGETSFNLHNTIGNLGNEAKISVFSVPPTFTEADLAEKMSEINEKSKNPLILSAGVVTYTADTATIVSWVSLAQPKRVLARQIEGDEFYAPIFIAGSASSIFASSLISDYLLGLSGKINTSPVNAQLAISGDRATIFVPSRDGKSLNIEKSTLSITEALDTGITEVKLTVDLTKPEVSEDSLNNMGITELLSTGSTNFAGSPVNRRHNIKIGASKFNGVLIKPDQNFSFNTTLGAVDASTGYLPELVIKDNKTIPEYGGGMCQVSSTAFRAALNGGLPILERTAHSYPVSYYKPYGVDATVYLPKPDLVFKNDTGKYILIQTRIVGNNLYYDFYGTKAARTMKFGGSENQAGAIFPVESITPYIYDQGVRGNNSFSAVIYRFIYDSTGKLTDTDKFTSKYDSPDKYPH